MSFRKYLRACYENKVTAAGAASLVSAVALGSTLGLDSDAFLWTARAACVGLFPTLFGLDTCISYRTANMHIEDGNVDPVVRDAESASYCRRVGRRMALREANLSHLLK